MIYSNPFIVDVLIQLKCVANVTLFDIIDIWLYSSRIYPMAYVNIMLNDLIMIKLGSQLLSESIHGLIYFDDIK